MTLQEIYELAVSMGIKADPRGEREVEKARARIKKRYEDSPEKKKKFFDKESLNNPYSDSRILFGDPKTSVKRLLAGIDADASEVLLADRLREKGERIDLLLSHHPSGHALAGLYEVMEMQAEMFAKSGVPINVAHALMLEKMGQVHRRFSPMNHGQAIDTARLLNVPLLALHTVWDNLGHKFMEDYLSKKEFDTAGEVLDAVNEIPEFIESTKGKSGPFLAAGSTNSRAGKIAVGFTGGTSAPKELYSELAKAGVGTLVEMHVSEETLTELKKIHINVIDTGHMAADSIGANIFLDELTRKGIEIIPCSGLIRVKRK
ncbi:MAG: NGG1p interacting factor NIF3 [Candidatus Levybacteria bacterium RIFCSPLOWO2_01_FULL_36_13]|nr:MAG: NGG1p interacting factor NIF3 [Candidatus Levybacteria bacterium RIFCSPHIGHO2_01_FULL_36_15b]OGH35443.1 MAG: NGG1p interacting factor NIF3 [Candidatus Levybacteria bacterium RIFCSPLOWO2_01_FULL_36_13]